MNKKLIISFSIPLILLGQEVFASGGIEIQTFAISPSTNSSIQSTQNLMQNAKSYNPQTKLQPSPQIYFNQNNYEIQVPRIQQESINNNQQRCWPKNYKQRNTVMPKNQQNRNSSPNNAQPKWWRQEGAYEGWKFD